MQDQTPHSFLTITFMVTKYFAKIKKLLNSPCMCTKIGFMQNETSAYSLIYPYACILIPPPQEGVGLVEYFCTHLYFVASEEDPDFIVEDVEQEVASAPNAACGVGPLQDAFVGTIL